MTAAAGAQGPDALPGGAPDVEALGSAAPGAGPAARVPVTVLTGFLGSGKTTLLNRILSEQHGLRVAVVENEFGEITIDDALVIDAEEEVFEMSNGCICCTVRGDLIRILGTLVRREDRFDRILIETTGLADPAPVAQTFFTDDEIAARLRLDAIVTVVDAAHLLPHLDERPDGVVNEALEQVAFADRVLLNKTDLVDDAQLAEVRRRVREVNRLAEVIETVQCEVDLDRLLDVGAFDLTRAMDLDPDFLAQDSTHQHDLSVTSVGLYLRGELAMEPLNAWLGELLATRGVDIFRSKGVLAVAGMDERYVFQGVHMLFDGTHGQPWEPHAERGSRLVFIGRDLDRDALESGLHACLAA